MNRFSLCGMIMCKYPHLKWRISSVQNVCKITTGKSYDELLQHDTRMPMTTCMLAWHSTIRTSMTSSMIAWLRTMRTPGTTSTERRAHFLGSVVVSSSSHTHCTLAQVWVFHVISTAIHVRAVSSPWSSLSTSCSTFRPLFLFLNYMKSMANLHNSCNEGVDAFDDLPPLHRLWAQGPWLLRDHSRALRAAPGLAAASSADPDYDDAALEDMPHQAHRAQVYHSLREDLSVSLSSSSMSDRTGQLVGDRSGQPGEHRSSEAQTRTLVDDQKEQILAKCQARISQHEFQAARAEEKQRLLQGQLLQQKLARRKFVEDQNTILELSGRVQELQNEVHCMNDSKDFQDAEPIRSGNSHVTSRPVSFPPHPILEGMLRHSFVTPSRREGPPSI